MSHTERWTLSTETAVKAINLNLNLSLFQVRISRSHSILFSLAARELQEFKFAMQMFLLGFFYIIS